MATKSEGSLRIEPATLEQKPENHTSSLEIINDILSLGEEFFVMELTPEEYAARYGHRWVRFELHTFSYDDPFLEDWIKQLSALLSCGPSFLRALRLRYLTREEIAQIEEEEEAQLREDLSALRSTLRDEGIEW